MIARATHCTHEKYVKNGKSTGGLQRFKCKSCGTRFTEDDINEGALGNMRVDVNKAMLVLGMLLEGMSIRAASRLTSMDKDTICRLILEAGKRCQRFLDCNVVDVPVTDLQLDEIWSKVYCSPRVQKARKLDESLGDSWTYLAVDRETKLIAAHHVGKRTSYDTDVFLARLRDAVDTSQRFQVSTDGWAGYKYGVPFALGSKIDFAQLIKRYKTQQDVTRYSPAQIISAEKRVRFGQPDEDRICTSHVESLNQKVRMHLRRFTRLTNAHSKSVSHHEAMLSIFVAYYNFCRVHSSLALGMTPAMRSRITGKKWTLREIVESV